jgi:hypothetical protein
MRRIVAVLVACLVVAVGGSQLVLPSVLEGRVADRLERGGGHADVSLEAVPAARLLFHHGHRLSVDGRGLNLGLTGRQAVFDRLDDFDEVRVRLTSVRAGPLFLRRFALTRSGGNSDYAVRLRGTTSPREVARFLGSRAAGALGGLIGDLATGVLPKAGNGRVPLDVTATVRSHGGRREVTSATGSVAGIPAGPIVQLVVDAVVRQL